MEALAMAEVISSYIPLAYGYSGQSGRISVPVRASEVLYSSFEHVAGVAAEEGGGAMSVDSLKILDILIERLESIRQQPLAAAEASKDLTPGRVDALIQQYGSELHAAAVKPAAVPYKPAVPAVESGMLFSVAA
jgi:hypothetical protein